MSLESELAKWAKSPEGVKALNEAAVKQFGTKSATELGYRLREKIYNHLPVGLRATFDINDIVVSEPVISGSEISVDINFNPSAIERNSLDQSRYGRDGDPSKPAVYDIVGLLTKGWHLSVNQSVYGEWHGKHIWNKLDRSADRFMQEAVDEFVSTCEVPVEVTLSDKYKV